MLRISEEDANQLGLTADADGVIRVHRAYYRNSLSKPEQEESCKLESRVKFLENYRDGNY